MLALILATIVAANPAPVASPIPAPTPTATPQPAYTFSGVLSDYAEQTQNLNATGALDTSNGADLSSRSDIANGLFSFTKNTGSIRYGITAGLYAFPVVGQAINPTVERGTNTSLYSCVPQVSVSYVPNANWTLTVGKLATMLGQEDGFTYQNLNIQRGLAWAAEPTFSRGVRATYTSGKFTGNLEANDGYYSGKYRAEEGLVGWAPSAATDLQFAFILPDPKTPPNPTASIANKAEYDFMVTQQFGKLQILPYALWIHSPSAPGLGYVSAENAVAWVAIANYTFNSTFSVAARYENIANDSSTTDTSLNADFIGYGPGSNATTLTLTPRYNFQSFFIRFDYSFVDATRTAAGLTFGPLGTGPTQSRVFFEAGDQF